MFWSFNSLDNTCPQIVIDAFESQRIKQTKGVLLSPLGHCSSSGLYLLFPKYEGKVYSVL